MSDSHSKHCVKYAIIVVPVFFLYCYKLDRDNQDKALENREKKKIMTFELNDAQFGMRNL